jgi:hypothetical protein
MHYIQKFTNNVNPLPKTSGRRLFVVAAECKRNLFNSRAQCKEMKIFFLG